MTLLILGHSFDYEMECLVRLFFPGEKIRISHQAGDDGLSGDCELFAATLRREGESVGLRAFIKAGEISFSDEERYISNEPDWEPDALRRLSVLMFKCLCELTGIRPSWGILTGVRPVNFCRKLIRRMGGRQAVFDALVRDYHVLPQKAELALETLRSQEKILEDIDPDSYSLYISIPFCATRCLYCSFVSHAIDKAAKLVPDYLTLLRKEISAIGELAGRLKLKLRTVYVGGGTPTALEPEQLWGILALIEKKFDLSNCLEYTVEAGRPDSISREKLAVLKKSGVSRISINPQTMDDNLLRAIGRDHTAGQTVESMELAREMGFDNINMDLIAGLPEQTAESFSDTVDKVIKMKPQNITVHTLTVKRSAALRNVSGAFGRGQDSLNGMLELSHRRIDGAGYSPYYLYRQQATLQNLENTGFSLPGREGLYNIYSMEEAHTILAAGAGGVTKLCGPNGRLKRVFNYKYPYEYISGFENIIARKEMMERFYSI